MWMIEQRDARDGFTELSPMLIWTDIPYNTGKVQSQTEYAYRDDNPEAVLCGLSVCADSLHPNGTMVVCCDYRMVADVIDTLYPMVFRGEIIWEFGLGRPRVSWWPNRHNHLLTFTHREDSGKFDPDAIPRAKRLAPKPGYEDLKPAGSVWDFTLSNTHPERVGYPNQKPLAIVEPFVLAHTDPGDLVCDPFCGSSTTGVAALKHGRKFYGRDTNPDAIRVSRERLGAMNATGL